MSICMMFLHFLHFICRPLTTAPGSTLKSFCPQLQQYHLLVVGLTCVFSGVSIVLCILFDLINHIHVCILYAYLISCSIVRIDPVQAHEPLSLKLRQRPQPESSALFVFVQTSCVGQESHNLNRLIDGHENQVFRVQSDLISVRSFSIREYLFCKSLRNRNDQRLQ